MSDYTASMDSLWHEKPRDVVINNHTSTAIPIAGITDNTLYTGIVNKGESKDIAPGIFADMNYNVFSAYRTFLYLAQARLISPQTIYLASESFVENSIDSLKNLHSYESPEFLDSIRNSSIPDPRETIERASQGGIFINPFSIAHEKRTQKTLDKIFEDYLAEYSSNYLVFDGLKKEYVDAISHFLAKDEQISHTHCEHKYMLGVADEYASKSEVAFPLALSRAMITTKNYIDFLRAHGEKAFGNDTESIQIMRELIEHSSQIFAYDEYFQNGIKHMNPNQRNADIMTIFHNTLGNITQTAHDLNDQVPKLAQIRPQTDSEFFRLLAKKSLNIAKVVNQTMSSEMPDIYTYNQPL